MQLSQPSNPSQCMDDGGTRPSHNHSTSAGGDGGTSGPDHSHSTSAGVCAERWAMVTAALDRNTNLLESLLSHTIHTRPGGTAPSSTPQGSESTEAAVTRKKGGLEFRVRTPRPHGKDPDELQYRVSFISTTIRCPIMTGAAGRGSQTYQHTHGKKKHRYSSGACVHGGHS